MEELEIKIDKHIEKHDEDYRKLMWWVVSTMATILLSCAGAFIWVGSIDNEVGSLHDELKLKASKDDLSATVILFNSKVENINENIREIKDLLRNK